MTADKRDFINPGTHKQPPVLASSFEMIVSELKLSPEEYVNSPRLREWVLRNKDEKYVPLNLLKAFGLDLED